MIQPTGLGMIGILCRDIGKSFRRLKLLAAALAILVVVILGMVLERTGNEMLAAVIFLFVVCVVAQCGGPGILIEKIRDWAHRPPLSR